MDARHKKILNKIPKTGRVLDIGCHVYPNNTLHRLLKAKNSETVGIDWQKGADVVHDLNFTLPFPSDSFDVIVAGEILEHLENPRASLFDWRRVLKTRGRLILTTPNAMGIPYLLGHDIESHVMSFTKGMLEQNLLSVGFNIIESCYLNSYYKRNMILRGLGHIIQTIRPTIFMVASKNQISAETVKAQHRQRITEWYPEASLKVI